MLGDFYGTALVGAKEQAVPGRRRLFVNHSAERCGFVLSRGKELSVECSSSGNQGAGHGTVVWPCHGHPALGRNHQVIHYAWLSQICTAQDDSRSAWCQRRDRILCREQVDIEGESIRIIAGGRLGWFDPVNDTVAIAVRRILKLHGSRNAAWTSPSVKWLKRVKVAPSACS